MWKWTIVNFLLSVIMFSSVHASDAPDQQYIKELIHFSNQKYMNSFEDTLNKVASSLGLSAAEKCVRISKTKEDINLGRLYILESFLTCLQMGVDSFVGLAKTTEPDAIIRGQNGLKFTWEYLNEVRPFNLNDFQEMTAIVLTQGAKDKKIAGSVRVLNHRKEYDDIKKMYQVLRTINLLSPASIINNIKKMEKSELDKVKKMLANCYECRVEIFESTPLNMQEISRIINLQNN